MKSVIVVGAGINGLMTAFEMRKAGWEVMVMDQAAIPNPKSASHGRHRLIHPYGSNDAGSWFEVESALLAWEVIWEAIGKSYFANTGVLSLETMSPKVWGSFGATTGFSGPQKLSTLEAEALMPLLRGGAFNDAYFSSEYGLLFADQILAAMVSLLTRLGVLFLPNTQVKSIDAQNGIVSDINGVKRQADCIVCVAGAGIGQILRSCDWDDIGFADFVTKRCYVLYADVPTALLQKAGNMPAWISFCGDDLWGAPSIAGIPLKMGCGALTHSATLDAPQANEVLIVDEFLRRYTKTFPEFRHLTPIRLAHNHWTQGPSANQVYQCERGFIVSACSGAGFKFAPLTGIKVLRKIESSQH